MSNIAGKAYAMNVLTPMKPWRTWINRFIFTVSRARPSTLSGLLGLSLIHFARWVIIRRNQWPNLGQGEEKCINDYMLFCSNFNGTWDQYIDAFSDGIPNGLNLFWYSSNKYPQSIPVTPFKNYIRHNQVDTSYYYNAAPGATQRDIKAALRVYDELLKLEQAHTTKSAQDFAADYAKALGKVQNCLGSTGYAPTASEDTDKADANREPFVLRAWGTGAPAQAAPSPATWRVAPSGANAR
jgi:hypothetical protein